MNDCRPLNVVYSNCRVSLNDYTRPHFTQLDELVTTFRTQSGKSLDELKAIAAKLDLNDLNRCIYHCDTEERDMGKGTGSYDIPGYGPLVYCGTQGFASILAQIAPINDLGHPICNNLRQGNWMIGEDKQNIVACVNFLTPRNVHSQIIFTSDWRRMQERPAWRNGFLTILWI